MKGKRRIGKTRSVASVPVSTEITAIGVKEEGEKRKKKKRKIPGEEEE